MNWFYAKDGQRAGPVDDEEFARLLATGAVNDATLVWRTGLAEWKPYAEVRPAVAPAVPAVAAPMAPSTEAESTEPAPAPATTAGHAGALPYAGFWIRVAASLFDGLILAPVFTLLYLGFVVAFPDFLAAYPAGANDRTLFEIIALTINAAYQTLSVGRFAATPGEMICNLRVVSSAGGRISYGRALCRYFCEGLSGLFFGAGFIMVAFNRQKCALHDFLCDTRVIYTD